MYKNMIKGKYSILNSMVSTRNMSTFTTETILNPTNKARCIRRFTSIKVKPLKQFPRLSTKAIRRAAVLVPLCHDINNELALLYTLRSSDLKSHRGQISFPGGMEDEEDKTLVDTALRETEEELGIKRSEIEVWCMGNPVQTPATTVVTPVIGYIAKPNILKYIEKNPTEVEDVFTIPLTELCKPENCKHTQFIRGFSTPVFLGGPKKIWGLTGLITHFFLLSIMPKGYYNHVVEYIEPIKEDTNSKL